MRKKPTSREKRSLKKALKIGLASCRINLSQRYIEESSISYTTSNCRATITSMSLVLWMLKHCHGTIRDTSTLSYLSLVMDVFSRETILSLLKDFSHCLLLVVEFEFYDLCDFLCLRYADMLVLSQSFNNSFILNIQVNDDTKRSRFGCSFKFPYLAVLLEEGLQNLKHGKAEINAITRLCDSWNRKPLLSYNSGSWFNSDRILINRRYMLKLCRLSKVLTLSSLNFTWNMNLSDFQVFRCAGMRLFILFVSSYNETEKYAYNYLLRVMFLLNQHSVRGVVEAGDEKFVRMFLSSYIRNRSRDRISSNMKRFWANAIPQSETLCRFTQPYL